MNFIADSKMPDEMIAKLDKIGKVYLSVKLNTGDETTATHPDMQIHFTNSNTAFCPPSAYEYYKKILPQRINLICGKEIGSSYPENCAYNAARIGKFVICNKKHTDIEMLSYYTQNGYTIIDVKQGYTKCNICAINEDTFITEDRGIYSAAKKIKALNPVLIDKGGVLLKGFEYGFIGGATSCGLGIVIFCGSINTHPSKALIKRTLSDAGLDYIELSDSKLTDFGSIIAFK